MNTFERHLFEDWAACTGLLARRELDEVERRLLALIGLMERCQDRAWLAATC